jgi:two-component system nitrate/nitrite response regulator NarL
MRRSGPSPECCSDGFDVTGDVHDGAAAIAAVREQHPDVVLLDVQLPDIDGFEVAERLACDPGAPSIVLTSSRSASDYGSRLRNSHAKAFIPKQDLSGQALTEALSVGA